MIVKNTWALQRRNIMSMVYKWSIWTFCYMFFYFDKWQFFVLLLLTPSAQHKLFNNNLIHFSYKQTMPRSINCTFIHTAFVSSSPRSFPRKDYIMLQVTVAAWRGHSSDTSTKSCAASPTLSFLAWRRQNVRTCVSRRRRSSVVQQRTTRDVTSVVWVRRTASLSRKRSTRHPTRTTSRTCAPHVSHTNITHSLLFSGGFHPMIFHHYLHQGAAFVLAIEIKKHKTSRSGTSIWKNNPLNVLSVHHLSNHCCQW